MTNIKQILDIHAPLPESHPILAFLIRALFLFTATEFAVAAMDSAQPRKEDHEC